MTSTPNLVVLVGRHGTGKTTPARLLTGQLKAAYVRIDAIEAAVLRRLALPRAPRAARHH